MAKKVKAAASNVNIDMLKQIASGFMNRISKDDADPLLNHNPVLIQVNELDIENGKALVRLTTEGQNMVDASTQNTSAPAANGAVSQFEIFTNAALPARKRAGRGAGATAKYPFDKLDVGAFFFVPKSAETPNPVKTLASTISAQNMKFAEKTGNMKTVERTKRGPGNKAVVENGVKVKETVQIPETKLTRKFAMRSVKEGQACGGWTAPADGVLISRVALD